MQQIHNANNKNNTNYILKNNNTATEKKIKKCIDKHYLQKFTFWRL